VRLCYFGLDLPFVAPLGFLFYGSVLFSKLLTDGQKIILFYQVQWKMGVKLKTLLKIDSFIDLFIPL